MRHLCPTLDAVEDYEIRVFVHAIVAQTRSVRHDRYSDPCDDPKTPIGIATELCWQEVSLSAACVGDWQLLGKGERIVGEGRLAWGGTTMFQSSPIFCTSVVCPTAMSAR